MCGVLFRLISPSTSQKSIVVSVLMMDAGRSVRNAHSFK